MLRTWLLKSSLNKKLVGIMLFLNLCIIFILVFLYYQSEKILYNEFERQTSELLKAIQIGLEQATGSGDIDETKLQDYLLRLNTKGVSEISVISTSDRIISSTNPRDIGKWISRNKKELIIKADLGEPVTGEGQVYSVMIPVANRRDEIGDLANSFNYMINKLREDRTLKERLWKAEHLAGIGLLSRNIAHEIKNPLNFISLSVDHIKDTYRLQDPEQSEKLETLLMNIKKEIQRVSTFAESFLQLGKPIELNLQQTDMGALISEVLDLVSIKARKDHIIIERHIESSPKLMVDPDFIRACLYNIIINAFQAMHNRGVLTLTTHSDNNFFSIELRDTGAGVQGEAVGKVFDPFFTTKKEGLGLGLAFTKKILEEHGGKVSFQSAQGMGSTVILSLPAAKEGYDHAGHSH